MKRFLFCLFLASLFIGAFLVERSSAAGVRVLILPFDMHGSEDIAGIRRGVMERLAAGIDSLGGEIVGVSRTRDIFSGGDNPVFDEKLAQEIAADAKADFALLGSVTKIGGAVNVNWRILDVRDGTLVKFYFKTAFSASIVFSKVEAATLGVYDTMTTVISSRPVERSGIVDIISVVGNRRVDDDAVLTRVLSRVGEPFDQDSVKEDLVSIFGMGYFDDVTADLSDTASGKELKFIVKERPFLKSFSVVGNSEVGTEEIEDVMTLKENTVLDRVLIKQNAEMIRMLYATEGFYMVEVETVVDYVGVDAAVTYRVTEGEEVRVKRITFIGNEEFSSRKLRKIMGTKRKGLLSFITKSGKFDEFIFGQDLGRIMAKYFDNGYVQADILEHSVQLSEDKKWFYITISLKEGGQYTVSNIDITGDILTTRAEIAEKIELRSGEIFNRSKLSAGMEAIAFMYGDDGYANADIVPGTKIDAETKTIDVTVNIAKNDLVYIERIDITGNMRTRDRVIRRELEVKEGELYSSSGLKYSEGNLRRLGYFEEVTVLETPGTTRDRIRLETNVIERPTGSFTLGLGFSSVENVIGTASVSQSNLLGMGLKLELSGTISSKSSKYVFNLTEPWLFGKPLSVGLSLYNTKREYPDFELDKKGVSVSFGFPIRKRATRAYLTYKYEDAEITDVAADATQTIKDQEGDSQISSMRLFIKHDTRNDIFFPREGLYGSFTTEYAGGILGGNTNFVKYEASLVKYVPIPWKSTFSLRVFGGYIHSFAGKEIPVYERFYMGGINTLRGFKTREVGPKDPTTGEFIGGETGILTNAEILFPLFGQKSMRGLLFFDAGNAYDGSVDLGDIRKSVGLGLRWQSPVGPIRLELGFNLSPRDNEEDYQWDFAMGTAF